MLNLKSNLRKKLLLGFVLLAVSFVVTGLPYIPHAEPENFDGPTLQVICPVVRKPVLEGRGVPFSVIYTHEKSTGYCTGISSADLAVNPPALLINTVFWFSFSFLLVGLIQGMRGNKTLPWFYLVGFSFGVTLLVFSLSYNLPPLSRPIYGDKIVECNNGNMQYCPYASDDAAYNAQYEANRYLHYDKGWPVAYEATKVADVPINRANLVADIGLMSALTFTMFLVLGGVLSLRQFGDSQKPNASK